MKGPVSPRSRSAGGSVKPRRRPRQERSGVTVDAILEAASQLFAAEGFDPVNTTRIAARAGVGVGSLYEYFPNKDALVAMLLKRHCDSLVALFTERFTHARGGDLEEMIAVFMDATYIAYAADVDLHRVLIAQMPRVSELHHLRRVSQDITAVLADTLATCRDRIDRPDLPLAAALVETLAESVVHRTLLHHPERFDRALMDEVGVMALRYLRTAEDDGARQGE